MKTIRLIAAFSALLLTFSACKKDDHDHAPQGNGPLANFTVSGGDCGAPCDVVFTNTSSNSVSYTWDFGDGTPVSAAATGTVTHRYQEPGTYTVTLTAKAQNNTTGSKVLAVEIKEDIAGNIITANPYRLASIMVDFQGQMFDGFAFYPDCQKDDLYKFNQGGEYLVTDAGMQCSPPSSTSGTWAFNTDQTKLTISSQGINQTFDIISMSEQMLVLQLPDAGMGGSATFTYYAQ